MFSLASLLFLVVNSLIYYPYLLLADDQPPQPTSRMITILGSVYCDVCYHNSFSKHSYFLPGVDVHVQCKLKASSPRTAEQISFSVNRTTDRYGMYKVDIPSVDGVDCTPDPPIQSFCQATLIGSTDSVSASSCNVPSTRSSSTEITLKSKQNNVCSYTLGSLSYKPLIRNFSLCGRARGKERLESATNSWNSSKTFLPYIPPYVFPWPQLPPLPQFPPLPPLPPLPPFPSFPFPPTTNPPSLPFPFPPLPPFTPPAFNIDVCTNTI
ncbi:hypothetical protein BUALT_Bualt05G0172000 [Buddleja alternifolia]|uniref:Pollen Ole e 1 allergen and extensin family protein n=1 Tax=Buddleja alternifolia TaxID=168488 RepID=A0AAV6XJZ5_9LAMI|nr:hypothetical protein BUALT_Bualt05G0172000 [Buddleja alternifolia]